MKVEHKIVVAFTLGFLVLALVGAGTYTSVHTLLDRNQMVGHTYRVISTIDDLLGSTDELQSGARGFLLTGKRDYLQPYQAGIGAANSSIKTIRELTIDNPLQQQNLERLQSSFNRLLAGTQREVVAREAAAGNTTPPNLGIQDKENMDQVRFDIATLKAHETHLLDQRDAQAKASASHTLTSFAVILALAVVLLAFFYAFIRHDFAARRRADKALRESDKKIRGVMDGAPDALLITGPDGKIQMVNSQAEQLFSYPRDAFTGQSLDALLVARLEAPVAGESGDAPSRLAKDQALRDLRSLGARFDGIRKDGTTFPVDLKRSPVHVGDEELLISAVRDRTEQQRAEEAMQKFSLDLARSNAELERFAYVASHDLQEPLRMVSSYTQLLAKRYKGKLDANADEFIAYAVDGASRMQKLINDLLALSRVGTQAKPFEPVPTGAILSRVLSDMRPTIEGAAATVAVPDTLPTVLADATQIGQLFQNLIGNALKFRGTEAPRVDISARPEDDGRLWRFAFRDNGIGIEPQYFERIFVIFQRLHSKESYPGTGIGLAICKKIVERHGGHMWVESTPGAGATFLFTLPAAA